MDKGVRIQNRCICKNLSGTVQRKASFQIPFHIPGNLVNKPILTIFQNCDLIFRFRMIVIDVILVGNKALVRNDFPDTFIGLLSPSSTGQLNGMVGVYVVMAAYFLYLGTDVRAVSTNVFRNGTGLPRHGSSLLIHIGNIYNDIVSQKAEKCNRKMLIQLYFSTGFWFLDCLPRARLKVMKSLNY